MNIVVVSENNWRDLESLRGKIVGFDVETNGTNRDSKLCTMQFYDPDVDISYIVPVYINGEYQSKSFLDEVLALYKTMRLVGHDLMFDISVVYNNCRVLPADVADDTFILACMRQKKQTGLKELAVDANPALSSKLRSYEEVFGSFPVYDLSSEKQLVYMGYDPYLPFVVKKNIFDERYRKAYELELSLIIPLCMTSCDGLQIDRTRYNHSREVLEEKADALQRELDERAGKSIRVHSVKDVRTLLFEDMRLPIPPIRTKKGEISVAEEALLYLEGDPVVDLILELKHIRSALSSIESNLKYFDFDDRVHPEFQTVGFDGTGRIYTTKPSINQWPWEMRDAIVPGEGNKFVHVDWKAAELFLACFMAGQEDILEIYRNGGDLHTYLSSKLLGVESPTKEQREVSKVCTFATMYGSEGPAVARKLRCSDNEAMNLVSKYGRILDKVTSFRNKVHSAAERTGYTNTILERPRFLPLIFDPVMSAKGKRQSFNTKIQGSCADLQKLAMKKLFTQFRNVCSFRFTVFDSFLLEFPESATKEDIEEVLNSISDFSEVAPGLKLRYDYGIGYSWDEAHRNS